MARRVVHAVVVFLFRLLSRLDVQGWEKVPAAGAALLASNHVSRLDVALIFALLTRDDSTSLVADTYKKTIFGPLISMVKPIWINREQADLHALREARQYLQQGGLLGIAPEGTRSRTGKMIPAKSGVAYLADKAGCPIIPVAIWGTPEALPLLARLHRPTIHVRVGDPICLPRVPRQDREAALQRNTDEIMCHIAILLPEEHRGVYADHSRLQELLAAKEQEVAADQQISMDQLAEVHRLDS